MIGTGGDKMFDNFKRKFNRIKNEIRHNFEPDQDYGRIEDVRCQSDADFLSRCRDIFAALENVRLRKLKAFELRKKIGLPAALLLTPVCAYLDYMLLFLQRGNDDSGAGITFLVLGGLYWWVTKPRREYAREYKKGILPDIAKLFGHFSYQIDGEIPMQKLERSKIIPHHHRYKSEDYFFGEYNGVKLEFSEIHLEERRGSGKNRHWVTVFKGLAVLLDLKAKRFHGHTILDRDRTALFDSWKSSRKELERAHLVDPEFEDLFDVYTDDQVEARYLVDPVMMERLKELHDEYHGKGMMAALYENQMLIIIASDHNHFEPANIYIPAADPTHVLNMKKEVESILSIIDRLELFDPDKAHEEAGAATQQEEDKPINPIGIITQN